MPNIKHIFVVLVMRRRPNTRMLPAATATNRVAGPFADVRAALKAFMRAGGIGVLLIAGCGLSLIGLYALDRLQDPHKDEVRAQIEYARQNAQLRECLALEPLVLDVTAPASAAAGVPSRPSQMTVAYQPTKAPAAASGASAPLRMFKAVSLEEYAASVPTFTSDDTKFQQRVELCRSVWAARADERTVPWLRAHVLEPGSSLNAALRLLRLLAIGLLAACSIELLLRLLSWAKLPVASFKDIAKAQEEKAPSSGLLSASPLGLARIIGTTLVTGVTGTTVLVPEMLHQFSWRERGEWRQDIDRHVEKTNIVDRGYTYVEREPKTEDGRVAADLRQATDRLELLQQRLETTLQRIADRAPSARQWQALEQLAEKGIAPVRTVADPKGLDGVRQSLAEVRQAVEGVKPGIERSLVNLDGQAERRSASLASTFADATKQTTTQLNSLAELARQTDTKVAQADRRAAGLLHYAGNVESTRWFFPDEANLRRCIVLLADDDVRRFNELCKKYADLLSSQQVATNRPAP